MLADTRGQCPEVGSKTITYPGGLWVGLQIGGADCYRRADHGSFADHRSSASPDLDVTTGWLPLNAGVFGDDIAYNGNGVVIHRACSGLLAGRWICAHGPCEHNSYVERVSTRMTH